MTPPAQPSPGPWERWIRPRIPDDRGRPVSPVRIDGLSYWDGSLSRLPNHVQERARRVFMSSRSPAMWWYVFAPSAFSLLLFPVIMYLVRSSAAGSGGMRLALLMAACALLGLVFSVVLMVPVGRRIYAARFKRVLIEESCCPGCGYTLAALPPEPDGCVVCPECGAAWRLAPLPPPGDAAR